MTKLYAHWINCIKDDCPESKDGQCVRGKYERLRCEGSRGVVPFPEDGKCLFPDYVPYTKEIEALGAYETDSPDQPSEASDIPF